MKLSSIIIRVCASLIDWKKHNISKSTKKLQCWVPSGLGFELTEAGALFWKRLSIDGPLNARIVSTTPAPKKVRYNVTSDRGNNIRSQMMGCHTIRYNRG